MTDDVKLLGLPTPGLRKLGENLGIQFVEDAETRRVCEHPAMVSDFSVDALSRRVTEICRGDKNRFFLMAYAAPAEFLNRQMERASGPILTRDSVEAFALKTLDFWRVYHLALLGQYRQNEGIALLINGDRSIAVDLLLTRLEERVDGWPGQIDTKSAKPIDASALARQAYARIVDVLAPQCVELYAELESCAELMGRPPEFGIDRLAQPRTQALDTLRLLAEEARIAQILIRHGMDTFDLDTQLTSRISAREVEARTLRSENESLLLQLDQVQKELDRKNQACQKNEEQLDKFRGEVELVTRERDKFQKLHQQANGKIAASEADKNALRGENESLVLQLHQVQEEFENEYLSHQKNQDDLVSIRAEIGKVTQERDRLKQFHEQLTRKISAAEADNNAIRSDNKLLLLKLHQTQEELEHYYLLHQEGEQARLALEQQIEDLTASLWKRISNKSLQFGKTAFAFVRSRIPFSGALVGVGGKRRRVLAKQANTLRQSGEFDEKWYLDANPDVAQAGYDPIEHYLKFGSREGRNPSSRFNTRWYLESNPDVADADMNPLLHYVKFGKDEGRQPTESRT